MKPKRRPARLMPFLTPYAAKSVPTPPKHLSPEAVEVWGALCGGFELEDESLIVLATALEAFDRMRSAKARIDAEGLTTVDRHGQLKAHPAVQIEAMARRAFSQGLKSLGLDLEPLKVSTKAGA